MKKIFVIATLASLVLASCTKADTQSFSQTPAQPEVSFKSYTAPVVKGWMPTGDFKEEGKARSMEVSGFVTTKDSTDFFVGRTFNDSGAGVYKATPTIYYPLGSGDKYAFLAFSDSAKSVHAWEGGRKVVLEVDTAALKHDIVAANFTADGTSAKVATGYNVPAKFYHTQALVSVVVKAADNSTEAAKVTVDTIILKNVYNIGKLTLTYNNTTAISAAGKPNIDWNFFGLCKCDKLAMDNGNFGTSDAGVLSTDGKWVKNTFNATDSTGNGYRTKLTASAGKVFDGLYPANQKPSAFEFLYTVNGKQMSAEWNIATIATKWEAGKHYIYNITIGMYEVMIEPEVNDTWSAVTITPNPIEVL